mmetsp:Transcript_29010/g.85830  ORF Transcript_29010/g.85830 Transcript_29010/m.85830 type:complete len:183 (-) Transcript_29010:51-599(-)
MQQLGVSFNRTFAPDTNHPLTESVSAGRAAASSSATMAAGPAIASSSFIGVTNAAVVVDSGGGGVVSDADAAAPPGDAIGSVRGTVSAVVPAAIAAAVAAAGRAERTARADQIPPRTPPQYLHPKPAAAPPRQQALGTPSPSRRPSPYPPGRAHHGRLLVVFSAPPRSSPFLFPACSRGRGS